MDLDGLAPFTGPLAFQILPNRRRVHTDARAV